MEQEAIQYYCKARGFKGFLAEAVVGVDGEKRRSGSDSRILPFACILYGIYRRETSDLLHRSIILPAGLARNRRIEIYIGTKSP